MKFQKIQLKLKIKNNLKISNNMAEKLPCNFEATKKYFKKNIFSRPYYV